ncbi:MAG: hypothetical protein O3B31_11690 [Chloroflexi bacterium]|nr:hypothetical protein [Chloroflexota bacterium]
MPEAGWYELFVEFERAAGAHELARVDLRVGEPGQGTRATLIPDLGPARAGETLVSLLGANAIRAGERADLGLHIADARTGAGVTTLRPYLAAAAHIVILDDSVTRFGHAHGSDARAVRQTGARHEAAGHSMQGEHAGHAAPVGAIGPNIVFSHTFEAPGRYRLWAQFMPDRGEVQTVSFVVAVR